MGKLVRYSTVFAIALLLAACGSDSNKHSLGWEKIPQAITFYQGSGNSAYCVENAIASSGGGLSHIESSRTFISYNVNNYLPTPTSCKSASEDIQLTTAEYFYEDDYHAELKKIYDANDELVACERTRTDAIGQIVKTTDGYGVKDDECGATKQWSYKRTLNSNGNIVSFSYQSFNSTSNPQTSIQGRQTAASEGDRLVLAFSVTRLGAVSDEAYLLLNQLPIKIADLSVGDYQIESLIDYSGEIEQGKLVSNGQTERCYKVGYSGVTVSLPSNGCENSTSPYRAVIDY